jgi:hypothetical protein
MHSLRRQVQFTNGVNIMTRTMHDGDLVIDSPSRTDVELAAGQAAERER